MIVTENLSKQFEEFIAVDGVNLKVESGEVLALLGPNGSGKTTTVRMLTSILRPTRGWARVAGFDVVKEADQVRASVGVLTEHHGLYSRMPAEEYLDFFGELYGIDLPTRKKRIDSMLERFGLSAYRQRRVGKFSRGMQQKLSLARTLLHEPPVLLLDEPTSAMDPESARLVRDAIQALRSSHRAIILCSHNLAEAEELADKIAIIRYGTIIAQGTTQELRQRLLGPAVYEVRFGSSQNLNGLKLPNNLPISMIGDDWLRYRTSQPEDENPLVLQYLLNEGLKVVSLEEVPRSLEQIYLQVMNKPEAIDLEGQYVA
ncbi:MAG: ABC transporter ATP-binding protein [Chloroflexota bacterium]|nr:MAG: ABC transporter ATP-binding protein [Chloroflexota bacterium]